VASAAAVLRKRARRPGPFELSLLLNDFLARQLRVGICHVAAGGALALTTPTLVETPGPEEEGSEDRTARAHAARLDGG
jgi:hypothetical protein